VTVRGSHKVPGGAEAVYDLLQDASVLQTAIPGCQELSTLGDGRYAMKMKVVIAALTGDFSGTVQIADGERPRRFRMVVEGNGRAGFLKGEGVLSLSPDGPSTDVSYEGDVHIGGTMASVGQRLLDATSKMMIRKFFERLTRSAGTAGPSAIAAD
jgi:carbon monoxide dehydrogenase subunit G